MITDNSAQDGDSISAILRPLCDLIDLGCGPEVRCCCDAFCWETVTYFHLDLMITHALLIDSTHALRVSLFVCLHTVALHQQPPSRHSHLPVFLTATRTCSRYASRQHLVISMTTATPSKRARIFQLLCPEIDVTVDGSMTTPSETHLDVTTHMKAAFCSGLEEIWPHDVNGEPLFNLDKSTHGERILMSSDRLQRIWPEPELKVLLYLEDGAAPKPLKVRT
jgi:hypothetical protein